MTADGGFRDQLTLSLPRLRRFAWGLAGSAEAGDDLLQAACERAIAREHQWQPGTSVERWMYRIIRTVHIDERRGEAVRARHLRVVQEQAAVPETGTPPPELRMQLLQVRSAMGELPTEQSEALMLVAVEGYSYREAAKMLELPIGTVASRVTRAREALVRLLGEQGSEADASGP